ncbi:fumarylacetoacetate hydrolase family protein [Pantoea sp. 18069]|uniref:fumarylacetoacetate hydrolase family protein n=1 Tax=Pantoea sp. 18069 TaxID=2681415 RepID=UPI00135B6EEF|nr:fumarylacetoacetate hydrolase family protein [Pantoea sp. 18069]
MKFLSFRRDGADHIGAVRGDAVVDLTPASQCGNLGEALRRLGPIALHALASQGPASFALSSIKTFRPVVADPARILCVGLNYEEHRVEAGRARTSQPTLFLRLPASQTGHEQPIIIPPEVSEGLDFEGEIAIVIGRGGRRIPAAQAWEHVFGYAPYNDASARAWQSHSTQWTAGKNFPATGAFGPFLVSADELGDNPLLTLSTRLNGQVMQQADTRMMIFPIPELIAYASTFTPLEPGDVIVTGTPGGVGFKRTPPVLMRDGDVVEVEVGGVGTLRNTIALEPPCA